MAKEEKAIITDEEIERDVAELNKASAWGNDRESLLKEAAAHSQVRKKYKGHPKERAKLDSKLPDPARSSKLATIGDTKEFSDAKVRAKLPHTFTGLYVSAQLYKAKIGKKALDAGIIHADATRAQLEAYLRENRTDKSRKPKERLAYSGYDARSRASFVKELKKLCAKHGLEPTLTPAKQPVPATAKKKEQGADALPQTAA